MLTAEEQKENIFEQQRRVESGKSKEAFFTREAHFQDVSVLNFLFYSNSSKKTNDYTQREKFLHFVRRARRVNIALRKSRGLILKKNLQSLDDFVIKGLHERIIQKPKII